MKAVYALYADGRTAQRAVDGLHAAGVPSGRITIVTAQPMEDFEFGALHRDSWMWYLACLGGLVGLVSAVLLAYISETWWAIPTGGMPIVSWWPNLIIIFELTMLGAILATVLTLIVSAGLLRRRPKLYDERVADGQILVGVEEPAAERLASIEHALTVTPEVRLTTI